MEHLFLATELHLKNLDTIQMQFMGNLDDIEKITCKKIFGKNQKNHRF